MTISTVLMLVAALAVAIASCLIGGAVLLNFSWWAVRMIWVQGVRLTRALSRLLIAGVSAISKAAASSLRFIYELAATALVVAAVPPLRRAQTCINALRGRMAAKRQGLLASDGAVLPDALPPRAPVVETQSVKPEAARTVAEPAADGDHEWALAVLGFAPGQSINSVDLKMRYTEMMKVVHHEKGFPNRIFADQTNKAYAILKRIPR